MGTRAVYTFIDDNGHHSVYKHWDGYPEGAAQFIMRAIPFAWKLPRWEAADFAAAFVAANKVEGGNVNLSHGREFHGDLSYYYEITCNKHNGQICVKAFESNGKMIFTGRLKEMINMFCDPDVKKRWNALVPSPHPLPETDIKEEVKKQIQDILSKNGLTFQDIMVS